MIMSKLESKEEQVEREESWGEALADYYNNELSENEEQWEIYTDSQGNKVAKHIK